jgi:hypothetical protein
MRFSVSPTGVSGNARIDGLRLDVTLGVIMKTKALILTVGSCLILAAAREARAVDGPLPLRCASPGVVIHNAATTLAVGTAYGTNLLGLAFTGTTTYDFYSMPVGASVSLLTSDQVQGAIYMQNTNPTPAGDFQATGEMRYYDYNPFTGTETLIGDTGTSGKVNVQHGQTTQWNMNSVPLPANYTIPAGDLLHVAVTITVASGNPGAGTQVLYNGPKGSTTVADITYPASGNFVQLAWPFGASPVASWPLVSMNYSPDPAAQISCYGTPGSNYLVQATTNVGDASSWVTLRCCVAATSGFVTYIDNDVTNYPCRFYRIAAP